MSSQTQVARWLTQERQRKPGWWVATSDCGKSELTKGGHHPLWRTCFFWLLKGSSNVTLLRQPAWCRVMRWRSLELRTWNSLKSRFDLAPGTTPTPKQTSTSASVELWPALTSIQWFLGVGNSPSSLRDSKSWDKTKRRRFGSHQPKLRISCAEQT